MSRSEIASYEEGLRKVLRDVCFVLETSHAVSCVAELNRVSIIHDIATTSSFVDLAQNLPVVQFGQGKFSRALLPVRIYCSMEAREASVTCDWSKVAGLPYPNNGIILLHMPFF